MVRTLSSIAAAGLVWLGLLACVAHGFVVVGYGPGWGRTTVMTMEASKSKSARSSARPELGNPRREALFSSAAMAFSSAVLLGSLRPAQAAGSAASSFYPQVCYVYMWTCMWTHWIDGIVRAGRLVD